MAENQPPGVDAPTPLDDIDDRLEDVPHPSFGEVALLLRHRTRVTRPDPPAAA